MLKVFCEHHPMNHIVRIRRMALGMAALAALSACSSSEPHVTTPDTVVVSQPVEWKLVWSDECDGPAGSPVDAAKWSAETGGSGWGNQEREYYTSGTANAALDGGGRLAITARGAAEEYSRSCWY